MWARMLHWVIIIFSLQNIQKMDQCRIIGSLIWIKMQFLQIFYSPLQPPILEESYKIYHPNLWVMRIHSKLLLIQEQEQLRFLRLKLSQRFKCLDCKDSNINIKLCKDYLIFLNQVWWLAHRIYKIHLLIFIVRNL